MSRSDLILAHHPHRTSATAGPNNSDPDDAPRRLDRDSSLSGSDDSSSVPHSPHTQKSSAEFPEDAQLTAQTLNADGTPKRPMNAFMIFARRRRPQVSAANQMMRTGEISKILSKEWTSMNLPDKQYYLDQAKHLKDNFNSKYPDYVYRRRPNNTRKKRKLDATLNTLLDSGASADPLDDVGATHGFDYSSSVEDDGAVHASTREIIVHSRSSSHQSAATSSVYEDSILPASHSTSAPYSYSSPDYSAGQYIQQNSRVHHVSPAQGRSEPGSSLSSLSPQPHLSELNHTYSSSLNLQQPAHSQSSNVFPSETVGGHAAFWTNAMGMTRGAQPRNAGSGWPSVPPLNTAGIRDRPLSTLSASQSDLYSPPSQRAWSSSHSQPSPSNSSASSHLSSQSSHFPVHALSSSSYYATQPHSPGTYQSSTPSSASTHSSSPEAYFGSSSHFQGGSFGTRSAGYDQPPNFLQLQSSVPHSATSPYQHGAHDPDVQLSARSSAISRSISAAGTLSGSSLSQNMHAMAASAHHPGPYSTSSQVSYWDRSKVDGH